jgi:cytidine deaminase
MTPCWICGSPIEQLALDYRDMKTKPCSHCEAVIQEMVNEKDDDYEFVTDEEFNEEESADLQCS